MIIQRRAMIKAHGLKKARYGKYCTSAEWSKTLTEAWRIEKMVDKMDKTEWTTASGSTVRAYIKTKMRSLADRNVMIDCYEFIMEIGEYGDVGQVEATDDGLLRSRFSRKIDGKYVHLAVMPTPDAMALWTKYNAEVSRREAKTRAAEKEYADHYNKVRRAMAE